ncbi:MAG TPA: D-alanine--D-alanine ligase [Chthonomonadaceae bacterium]|nr:D-alanine--D-alanine ligase [Chthonomonadaceae bacterium]
MSLLDRKLRVAVLMGGASSERPVSLATGKMILQALDPMKYAIRGVDTADLLTLAQAPAPRIGQRGEAASEEIVPTASADTFAGRPDVVFIALHGKGGEDGTVQGMLEFLDIPYTGSGVLASALAMNKAMTKRLLAAEGLPVIEDVRIDRDGSRPEADWMEEVGSRLGYPVFVKPNAEGSTFGCALVNTPTELPQAVAKALEYDSLALIERYVRGIEITAGVLEAADGKPEALPLVEIVPKSAYYDYESKYAAGGSDHYIPARLPEALSRQAQELALRCHALLGCRGMSRTDMLVENERLAILEVNTIPGMTPTSLLPQAAEQAGIPFAVLLDRLIAAALR